MIDRTRLAGDLARALGGRGGIESIRPVGGGDIHRAVQLRFGGRDWFVKWNRAEALPLFETEHRGLEALVTAGGPGVPRPLLSGADEEHAWLVMEWLDLQATGDAKALGTALANLHRAAGPSHGWDEDNYLGHTPQANGRMEDWASFWWRRRLEPQLALALRNGHGRSLEPRVEPLRERSDGLLQHRPAPSLLHGDLWGGNHAYLAGGEPVIFDPAPWHGDRETDLAMMRLFGGFDPTVFQSYEAEWPLPAGAGERLPLYQLYHLLNHLNLFGTGWLGRVEATLDTLLKPRGRV